MNLRKQKIVFWGLALLTAVPIAYVLAARRGPTISIVPMRTDRLGITYVKEFENFRTAPGHAFLMRKELNLRKQLEEEHQKQEALRRNAPNRSAEIRLEQAPFTSVLEGCHTFWLTSKDGDRKRLLKLYEAEPGSGLSFKWGWAKDSGAIFFTGQTAGFDCRKSESQEFGLIYTLADGTLWKVESK